MKAIGRAYRDALEAGSFADPLDVLAAATRMLGENPALKLGPAVRVLRPEGLELSALEAAFLDTLLPRPATALAVDAPESTPLTPERVSLACASGRRTKCAPSSGASSTRASLSTTSKSRSRTTPLPAPRLRLAQQAGFPCTFADGVPATFSRPAQDVLDVLDWIEGGYEERPLARLFRRGPREPRGRAPARRSRGAGPGGAGVPARANREGPRAHPHAPLARERAPRAPGGGRGPRARRDRRAPRPARRGRCLGRPPARDRARPRPGGPRRPRGARARGPRADRPPRGREPARRDGARGPRPPLRRVRGPPAAQAPDRRRGGAPARGRRDARGGVLDALPGHAHVARVAAAGWSGRGRTFVLGLDEARFPGGGAQDPVLLDHEREAVNRRLGPNALPLRRGSAPEESRRSLASLLARLRGRVVLSYSNRDFLQDAEQFPSSAVLEAFRALEGKPRAGFRDLFEREGAPAAFRPSGEPLDEIEWWLAALHAPGADPARAAAEVEGAYPWIADGREAEEARQSPAFTKWDGRLTVFPASSTRASRASPSRRRACSSSRRVRARTS